MLRTSATTGVQLCATAAVTELRVSVVYTEDSFGAHNLCGFGQRSYGIASRSIYAFEVNGRRSSLSFDMTSIVVHLMNVCIVAPTEKSETVYYASLQGMQSVSSRNSDSVQGIRA